MKTEVLPWFSPDDCVETCELLEETSRLLEQFAAFSTIRKELRTQLDEQARKCRDLLQRINQPMIDRALVLAVDEYAESKNIKTRAALAGIVETFISKNNRSA